MALPEPQLLQVMERLQRAIFGCDRHGRVLFVNAYGEALIGQLASIVQGSYLWEILPSAFELTAENALTCLEKQTVYQWDCYDPVEERWWQGVLYPDQVGLTLMMTDISQRQQNQILQQAQVLELEKWYHRFQVLGRLGDQLFWEWHRHTNWVLWSGNTLKIFGCPLKAMPRSIDEWIHSLHAEDQARVETAFWQACDTQTSFTQNYRLKHTDGTYHWLSDRREFVQTPEGQIHGWGVITDIHDRKVQESNLETSEKFYASLIEHLPVYIYRCCNDEHWTMEYVNQGIEKVTGYPPTDFICNQVRSYASLIHPDDRDGVYASVQQAISAQKPFELQYRIFHADGSIHWVEEWGGAVWDDKGNIIYLDGIIVDITKHKTIELALAESEYRWRIIFEATALGIVIVDPHNNYKIVSCNPAFCSFIGYSAAELLNLHPANLTFPEDWQTEQALIDQGWQEPQKFYQFKKRYRHRNGQIIWANLTLSCVKDDQHNLLFILALIENISDRQVLEGSLEIERFRYQQLVENSPNLILSLDTQKRLKTINWAALEVLDSLETDEGQSYRHLLHPQESTERVEILLDRVLCGESISDIELIFNSPDGQPRYMLTHLYPLVSDERQHSAGCVLISTDITEHKNALQRLNDREAQYRSVFESVTDGLHVFDLETGKLVEANPATCAMHGYTYEEFLHLNPQEFVHPDYHSMFADFLETVRAGNHFDAEAKNIRKDGSVIDIHVYGIQFSYRGRPHILSVVRDITKLKQIEAERQQVEYQLRESENLFRSLIHDLNVGVIVYSQTGQVQIVNHQACTLIGLTETQFLGKTYIDLDCQLTNERGESIPLVEHPVARAIATKQCLQNVVVGVHHHQTKKLLWLQLTADPQLTPDGAVSRVIVTFNDISDRKRNEDQLRHQAEREQTLNYVIQSIRDSIEIDTIFTTTVEQIGRLLKLDRALITEYMPEQKGWVAIHEHTPDPSIPSTLGVVIPEENNPVSDQVKQGKIVRLDRMEDINLPENDPNPCSFIQRSGGWLIFPLVINQQTWGTLTLQRYSDRPNWQDQEIALVQSVVNQLGVAIRQAQLYQDLQHANAELSRLATIDGLTQIANRRHFNLYLEQEWQRCLREQTYLSLVLCDVDYFKPYNDHYGHQAGDDCLVQIAQTLSQSARRSTDLVARYGGEEFALVLPNTDLEGALRVIRTIQAAVYDLNILHLASTIGDRITISFGVVTLIPCPSHRLDDFLSGADQSLYQAKQAGRNTYCVHELSYPRQEDHEDTSPDLRYI